MALSCFLPNRVSFSPAKGLCDMGWDMMGKGYSELPTPTQVMKMKVRGGRREENNGDGTLAESAQPY